MKLSSAKLLPLLIMVSLLSFAARFGEVMSGLGGRAYAQQVVTATPPPLAAKAPPPPSAPVVAKAKDWHDPGATDSDTDDGDVKDALYTDLAKRRADLDKRDKDLAAREALLKAGEREVDQKLQQLTQVRAEIQSLMKSQSDVEKARIDSLVKTYEGMKPEDAARIFNTLDMDLLVKLMSGISERKTGPILAAMSPDRARQVTQLLAQQKQLPEVPAQ